MEGAASFESTSLDNYQIKRMDCFGAHAPRNDDVVHIHSNSSRHCEEKRDEAIQKILQFYLPI